MHKWRTEIIVTAEKCEVYESTESAWNLQTEGTLQFQRRSDKNTQNYIFRVVKQVDDLTKKSSMDTGIVEEDLWEHEIILPLKFTKNYRSDTFFYFALYNENLTYCGIKFSSIIMAKSFVKQLKKISGITILTEPSPSKPIKSRILNFFKGTKSNHDCIKNSDTASSNIFSRFKNSFNKNTAKTLEKISYDKIASAKAYVSRGRALMANMQNNHYLHDSYNPKHSKHSMSSEPSLNKDINININIQTEQYPNAQMIFTSNTNNIVNLQTNNTINSSQKFNNYFELNKKEQESRSSPQEGSPGIKPLILIKPKLKSDKPLTKIVDAKNKLNSAICNSKLEKLSQTKHKTSECKMPTDNSFLKQELELRKKHMKYSDSESNSDEW